MEDKIPKTPCPDCGCIPLLSFTVQLGERWCVGCWERARQFFEWCLSEDAYNLGEADE